MSRAEQGRSRSRAVRVAVAAGVAVAASAVAHLHAAPAAGEDALRPNVVVISTDDQALSWFTKQTMPHTWRHLVRNGTRFQNAIVTTPLCCPARAAFMTGQYGHNNGVQRNRYKDLLDHGNVLPAWLQRAGYTTAHVGKWLNDYEAAVDDPAQPAPGWDHWRTSIGQPAYYNGKLSIDGQIRRYGQDPSDLLTRKIGRASVNLVRKMAADPAPFYLQVDHFAPHGDARTHEARKCPAKTPEPASAKLARFASVRPQRGKGFNEHDMSDKPLWAQGLNPISRSTRRWLAERYRCSLAAIRTVDSQTRKLLDAIKAAGIASETIVVFWSDNGFLTGEHRMVGKARPYEQAVRVPLVIKVPGAMTGTRQPRRVYEPVANIDLAPTILAYAGAEPCISDDRCRLLDGRALDGLLAGGTDWPRPRLLVVEKRRHDDPTPPPDSNPLDSLEGIGAGEVIGGSDPADGKGPTGSACVFSGIWTPDFTYTVYTEVWDKELRCIETRQVEIYDTNEDPYQLQALSPLFEDTPRYELGGETPAAALSRLANCAGTAPSRPNPCD